MSRSDTLYTEFFLLLAFLALVGASVLLGKKLQDDYKLTPQQMFGLEPADTPLNKSVPQPKAASAGRLGNDVDGLGRLVIEPSALV